MRTGTRRATVYGGRRAAAGNGLLNNLVYFYALNEAGGANDALDLHSNALTLTQVSSPGADTGQVYATARTFDGSADYFSRASEAALQTGDVDFTIAAWVYFAATPANSMRIVSKRAAATENDYDLYWNNATGKLEFGIGNATASATVLSAETPTTSTWYLVVAWHDAINNLLKISVDNGAAASQATETAAPAASASPVEIGRLAQLSSRFWQGRIGPVAMWKSAAGGGGVLSETQRAALWNGGAGLPYAAFTA